MSSLAGPVVRLAELVASLSLATDLGLVQPMEHVVRPLLDRGSRPQALRLDQESKTPLGVGAADAVVRGDRI
jgi:hypothetical protein